LDVRHDIEVLQAIHAAWFDDARYQHQDPKLDELQSQLNKLLEENPNRKIVVFSAYADTVNYVAEELRSRGMKGVFSFTAAQASKESRKILLRNFDAAVPEKDQEDEFQILVCTDALSEGVNLHRAGVIINYDIPYNPTRVIQRIGRINRINKKVFDKIKIFNFFPTVVGDTEIRVKAISTLKIGLINNIVGSDTRSLTPDEDLQTFFKDEFERADTAEDCLSWDSVFIEDYEAAIQDKALMERIEAIPRRSRVARVREGEQRGVLFIRRGQSSIFVTSTHIAHPLILSTEEALQLFRADRQELGIPISSSFAQLFDFAKEKLKEKHALPEIRGRRKDSLSLIEAVRLQVPAAENYCTDLATIIREFDDVSDGTLKDLAQIHEKSPEAVFRRMQELVPESFIRNIMKRVDRMENETELILLAEELRP
jgi:hypothetical protein